MVIVRLLTAGVGLALDAYAERQSSRDQRRNAGLPRQDSPHGTGIVSNDAKQRDRDIEAFNELQSYADFQKALSEKVLVDLAREDGSISHGFPPQSSYNNSDQYSSYLRHGPQLQTGQGSLPYPVIIPQYLHQDAYRWPRSYSSSLMECGIDQQAFLAFIDSFNESLKSSPLLDVVNVDKLCSGVAWRDSTSSLSMAIPAALRLAKTTEADATTNQILAHANNVLFRARGLFIMIVASLPDLPSQVVTVNYQNYLSGNNHISSSTSESNENLYTSFEGQNMRGSLALPPNRRLKQMSNFIADYSERRPHFRRMNSFQSDKFEQSTNSSSKMNTLQENLAHRKGPLSAFASSIANRNNHVGTQRRRKRRLEISRPQVSKSRNVWSIAEGTANPRAEDRGAKSSGRPMQDMTYKAEAPTGFHAGIQSGVLYLVVVNDIEVEINEKRTEQSAPTPAWNENGWRSGFDVDEITQLSTSSHGNKMDMEMASPPAYDSGSYFNGGMSNSGF